MEKRVIKLPQVMRTTGLSRSSIYAAMDNGTFPRSVALGKRSVGWVQEEVEIWIDERVALRDTRTMCKTD